MSDDPDEPRFRVIEGGLGNTRTGTDDALSQRRDDPAEHVKAARRALSHALVRLADDRTWTQRYRLEMLDEALAHDPENAAAWHAKSGVVDDARKSLACATRALVLDPTNWRYYEHRASLLATHAGLRELEDLERRELRRHERARVERSIADLNRVIQLGESARGYFRRGRAHWALGRLLEAYDDMSKALGDERFRGPALQARLQIARAMGREELRSEIERVLALDPADATARWHRAIVSADSGDFCQALADVDELLAADVAQHGAPSAYHLYLRAVIHLRRGVPELAIEDLSDALRIERDNGWFFARRAQAYAADGDRAREIADWRCASRCLPVTAEHYIGLGRAIAPDDPRQALREIRVAVDFQPRVSSHRADLAFVLASLRRFADARREIARARELARRHPRAQIPFTNHHTLARLEAHGLDLGHVHRLGPGDLRALERMLAHRDLRRG